MYSKAVYSYYPSLLHPPSLVVYWFVLLYGIPGLSIFIDDNVRNTLSARYDISGQSLGWYIVLIGITCLFVGYFLSAGNAKNHHKTLYPVPSINLLLTLYFISLGFRLLNTLVEGRGYGRNLEAWGPIGILFDNTFGYLEDTYSFVIVILIFIVFKVGHYRSLTLFIIATEILLAATTGFSTEMLFLLLAIAATLYYLRGWRLFAQHFWLLPAGLIIAVGVVPVTETLRTQTGEFDQTNPVEVFRSVERAFQESWGKGLDYGLEIASDKFIGRQTATSLGPGLVVSRTPSQIEYQGIAPFITIPFYIIPRFIWTSKPILTTGKDFCVAYYDIPETLNTACALSIFGESYTFFGIGSLVLAMLALGILFGRIFHFTVGKGKPYILLALIPTFIHIEGQFTTLFVGLLQNFLVYIFIFWLLMRLSQFHSSYIDLDQVQTKKVQ